MSTGIIDRALGLALESNRPFHVQLSGGEPTLVPEAVFHAAERVRRLSLSSTLGIQTNATGIDRAMADMMLKFNMDVGVSLDGPPRIQERLRGMARETFQGIKYLEEREIPFTVTTVVTRENLLHLDQLALMLGGFTNARGIGLDLLVKKGNVANAPLASGPDPLVPDPHELKVGIKKMVTALNMVNRMRKIPIQLRERNRLKSTLNGKGPTHFCRAAINKSLAVTPLGDLYPCTQTAFDPDFYWGNLENPKFMNSRASLAGLCVKEPSNIETCRTCPLEDRCPGDCPGRTYYNGNTLLACAMYKGLFAQLNKE